MDMRTAQTLCNITDDFYRRQCTSFSSTRRAPWNGWRRCAKTALPDDAGRSAASVFDLACGNLRFEAFLADEYPRIDFDFYAVDNCEDLVRDAPRPCAVDFQNLDVMGALLAGNDVAARIAAPACDLSVAFGFMHHIPGAAYRRQVLSALVAHTKPGGFAAVSFWQFLNSPQLAQKARETTACAVQSLALPPLDDGDYLLGWENEPGVWRYCHHFTEREIDDLVASLDGRADEVARFSCDGRTGNLNTYVVLKVR